MNERTAAEGCLSNTTRNKSKNKETKNPRIKLLATKCAKIKRYYRLKKNWKYSIKCQKNQQNDNNFPTFILLNLCINTN